MMYDLDVAYLSAKGVLPSYGYTKGVIRHYY